MKIFVITICNKNDNYLNDIIKKYSDLIDNFYKITFIDINFKQKKVKKNLYEKEYKKAVSLIKPQSYVVALDEQGKNQNSYKFSEKIEYVSENFVNLYFIIGGPDGLTEYIKKEASEIMSLSSLTFPHHLAKVILSEQIYRSICIMNNHPYHRS
jgi:23S rRNA (pseudouridine1915-N3)-methyltransferase|tara:strand:+ start:14598 stop:15059 length:462 start_codon:yes stop_codon:yes gene_type:complete